MKKVLSIGAVSLLAVSMMTGCASTTADNNHALYFDFEQDDSGFTPIFADYPNDAGVEEFYEFHHSYGEIPINDAGKGLFLSGNNHSGDLFMGYVKLLDGFTPGQTYSFDISFKLATDVEGELVGIGGAPGEGVAVKCGITSIEPYSGIIQEDFGEYYRLNIDAGIQSNNGQDMLVVGDMSKTENNYPGSYEFKDFQTSYEAVANESGEVWLIIGTDSGFEATTSYYLDDITVKWSDTQLKFK